MKRPTDNVDSGNESWLRLVRQQVEALHYGIVQIVVHDRRVVQIDRTEKLRLENPGASQLGSTSE